MITWDPTVRYPISATDNNPDNSFVLDKPNSTMVLFLNIGIIIKQLHVS